MINLLKDATNFTVFIYNKIKFMYHLENNQIHISNKGFYKHVSR